MPRARLCLRVRKDVRVLRRGGGAEADKGEGGVDNTFKTEAIELLFVDFAPPFYSEASKSEQLA